MTASSAHHASEPDEEPDEVYQAAGMLSVLLDTSCTAALSDLRDYAVRTDRNIVDVALDVIGYRLIIDRGNA